ncbi:MAG TPA: lipopolysaccharide heptosyltransferase II [Myxococcota bacterium]|nr:lipopolysaccharide heptosyltransferase II [Myxococcota bacterium]
MRRLLVRLPNPLGDAVMATPALRALRRGLPGAEIAVLGLPQHEGLLRGNQSFDAFIPLRGRAWRDVAERARELRRRGFDAAVLLPDSARAAFDPFAARIPVRVGYARDPWRRFLLTQAIEPPRERGARVAISMIERYLRVARALGVRDAGDALELHVDAAAAERAAAVLARAGVAPGEPVLLVTPGAAYGASKLWPPEHFARAGDEIRRRFGLLPVLAPAPTADEIAIARRVSAAMAERHVALLEPDPSLEVFAAITARADLILTNDNGARHVAVALGRPVVTLIGPTDPRHTAHLLDRQRVLFEDVACRPCGRPVCPLGDQRCLVQLAPERAVAAAAELLAAR